MLYFAAHISDDGTEAHTIQVHEAVDNMAHHMKVLQQPPDLLRASSEDLRHPYRGAPPADGADGRLGRTGDHRPCGRGLRSLRSSLSPRDSVRGRIARTW